MNFRDMGPFENLLYTHVNIGFYLSDPPGLEYLSNLPQHPVLRLLMKMTHVLKRTCDGSSINLSVNLSVNLSINLSVNLALLPDTLQSGACVFLPFQNVSVSKDIEPSTFDTVPHFSDLFCVPRSAFFRVNHVYVNKHTWVLGLRLTIQQPIYDLVLEINPNYCQKLIDSKHASHCEAHVFLWHTF